MSGYSAEYNTPSIRASEAVNLIVSEIQIDAPASVVFRTLRNTETWKDWNRFVPKVNITYQPPEEDSATAAEINEIVRNTSIIGSFYSDLTDGGYGGARPRSPDEQPPPRFRLNSISSQMSSESNSHRNSESIDPLQHRGSVASVNSEGSKKSGAQLFQDTTNSRRASIASGQEPAAVNNNLVQNTSNHRASLAIPAPTSPVSKRKGSKKPKHTQVVTAGAAMQRAQQALLTAYGEPSVRLQIKTKVTFFLRMKAASPSEFTEVNMVVTQISRPDDPVSEAGTTALTRSKTHTLDRTGKYRIVWANDSEGASLFNFTDVFKGSKMPSYLMQAERVHEIEATGENSCVYKTWELSKGHAAKSVKKKSGEYLQKMFDEMSSGLKEFCEGLHAPKVAVRDFSVVEDTPVVIQTLT